MKMFDVLAGIIIILKANVNILDSDNIFDYEPGEGMIDYNRMPSVFIYDYETNFAESEQDVDGSQDHDPTYYLDIYHSSKAAINQGNITTSPVKVNSELRTIITELYNILASPKFNFQLRKIVDINNSWVSRIEKLGTSKLPDSNKAAMAQRIFFKVKMNETPPGDDGVEFKGTIDEIDPQLPT